MTATVENYGPDGRHSVESYGPGALRVDVEPGREQVKVSLYRVAGNSRIWSITIKPEAAEELGMLLVRASLWGDGPDTAAEGSA